MLETAFTYGESGKTLESHSRDIPNYWESYGLQQAPFEDSLQYAMYYPLPQWQRYLTFLQQLPKTFSPLVLITGPVDSGKSMLIAQYMAQAQTEFPAQLVKGHMSARVSDIIDTIAASFGLVDDADNLPMQVHLKLLISNMVQNQKRGILVIDDAHRLPLETLSAVAQLALEQDLANIRLYIVLSGEPPLQNRIKNLLEILSYQAELPNLVFKPLTFEETQSYIKHRLLKAGLTGTMPFNEETVGRIFKLSGGVPGKINRLTRQVMINGIHDEESQGMEPITNFVKEKDYVVSFRRLVAANRVRIISVLLLGLVIAALWYGEHFVKDRLHNRVATYATTTTAATAVTTTPADKLHSIASFGSLSDAIPTVTAGATAENAATPATNIMSAAMTTQPEVTKTEPAATTMVTEQPIHNVAVPTAATTNTVANQAVSPMETTNTTSLVSSPAITTSNTESTATATTTATTANNNQMQMNATDPVAPVTDPAKLEAPVPTAPVATATTANSSSEQNTATATDPTTSATTSSSNEPTAVTAVPTTDTAAATTTTAATGYTLQLMGSYSLQDLQQFINQQALENAQYVKISRDGRDWYILIYGNYASINEAKKAIADLPAGLQSKKPWVRSLSVLSKLQSH